jgi:hypothetical protein
MSSRLCGLAFAALFMALGAGSAIAGGGSFDTPDDDDADAGPPYVGDVKDNKGNPIPDAKITVTVKAYNSSLVLHTDDQGHFYVKGFDKAVDPDEVEIACSQDGYKPYALSRDRGAGGDKAPVEITCLLEKT